MSFIYYVLIFLLYYAGPVYAGLEVEKEYEIVEEDVGPDTEPFPEIKRYAQAEVEVGELPSGKIKVFTDQSHSTTIVVDNQDYQIFNTMFWVEDNIEYYSNVRTYQAISRADVILVMLDANKGVMKQDKTIAQYVIQKGKGLVMVVNKWDLVTKNSSTLKEFQRKITHQFKALDYYPSLFISALTKQRVSKVLDFVWNVYQARQQKINTKDLNSWLEKVQRIKAPPAPKGKEIKIISVDGNRVLVRELTK